MKPVNFAPVRALINHARPTVETMKLTKQADSPLLTEKSSEVLTRSIRRTSLASIQALIAGGVGAFLFDGSLNLPRMPLTTSTLASLVTFAVNDTRRQHLQKLVNQHGLSLGSAGYTFDHRAALDYFEKVKPALVKPVDE